MDLHWDILDKKRRQILPTLAVLKSDGFYLAGGTALALQLGHRTSFDFDFYRAVDFEPRIVTERFSRGFVAAVATRGTVTGDLRNIHLSFFRYAYPLICPLIDADSLSLASLEDLAAMKLLAIAQRGKKRDFIDLYLLCQRFPLRKILDWTKEKFPTFDAYTGLRGLVYFQDAENERPRQGFRLLMPLKWDSVKSYFIRAAQDEMRRLP